jgi:hypothetical protein
MTFQVLKTIPFDKVDIKILDIEMNHIGEIFDGTPELVVGCYLKT